jgi:hypothetical protein
MSLPPKRRIGPSGSFHFAKVNPAFWQGRTASSGERTVWDIAFSQLICALRHPIHVRSVDLTLYDADPPEFGEPYGRF